MLSNEYPPREFFAEEDAQLLRALEILLQEPPQVREKRVEEELSLGARMAAISAHPPRALTLEERARLHVSPRRRAPAAIESKTDKAD